MLLALKPAQWRRALRLVVAPAGSDIGTDPIARPVGDSLVGVLCVLNGNDALVVPEHVAAAWRMRPWALWNTALVNMHADQLNVQTFGTDDSTLFSVNGTGMPGAGHVFRLDKALRQRLPLGALVSLPIANAFCAVPIRSAATLGMAGFLSQLTGELMRGNPAPLSHEVFWAHDGEFTNLRVRVDGDDTHLSIPERLRDLLT
ncbi:hypothetical protein [Allorhizocola rhizosphaerae]|uniref:hypothetical protein n=1 Tax=Allorhizocola rhizosphaerae TaxID=1872709 RepID=UPI000E3E1D95|nr:hypothetical protein [Allorhizocola rhizosphaerae]